MPFEPVALLAELVAIPSVNPEDQPGAEGTGERRMADWLAARLGGMGFRVREVMREPERPNIVAHFGPESARWTLLFESHLDTVGVQAMHNPFTARIQDGRLYGRGACDTKGPMAAALCALRPARLEAIAEAGGAVCFVGAMGEEKGNRGARELAAEGVGADEALILEPTELQVVYAHKGTLWLRLELTGRAGHGSDPAAGCSAIDGMARAMAALRNEVDAARAALGASYAEGPTLNVGTLHGGQAVNIVADRCVAELDRRVAPGEDVETVRRRVEAILNTLKSEGAFVAWRAETIIANPPFRTDPAHALVRDLTDAVRETGAACRPVTAAWCSDAGAFSRTCGQVAVFGPGSIRQAHTVDEYIELAPLRQAVDALDRFLAKKAAALRVGAPPPS